MPPGYPDHLQRYAPWAAEDFHGSISAETMDVQHVLHTNHVDRFNAARARGVDTGADLAFDHGGAVLYNLFWKSIRPRGSRPRGELEQVLNARRPSGPRPLVQELQDAAHTIQGSGWVLLAWHHDVEYPWRGHLSVRRVYNHDLAAAITVARGSRRYTPLLALNVWEHAWVIDHGADKNGWVRRWPHIIDWTWASRHLRALLTGAHRQLELL